MILTIARMLSLTLPTEHVLPSELRDFQQGQVPESQINDLSLQVFDQEMACAIKNAAAND
jgi:hypothetical protein